MMNNRDRFLLELVTVLYAVVFLTICVTVGFTSFSVATINGVFYAIYIFSLWIAGFDTSDFYGLRFFVSDLLSLSFHINIPRLLFSNLSQKQFLTSYWILFSLVELICVYWDVLCHNEATEAKAKFFHLKWILLTTAGILGCVVFVVLLNTSAISKNREVIVNYILIGYEFLLLLFWWFSKYRITRNTK